MTTIGKPVQHSALLIAIAVALLSACDSSTPDPYNDDTPTSGHALILADEDLRSIVDAEKQVFESIYTKATIEVRYLPEATLLKAMMNDSVRCVIATVKSGAEQEAFFAKRRIEAHVIPICMDGIAVVVNKARRTDALSIASLRRLLTEGHTEPSSSAMDSIMGIVWYKVLQVPLVSGSGSGVARTLVDSVLRADGVPLRAQALHTVDQVITSVKENPDHVGFIPFAAISDLDNPRTRALRDQVKLLPIARTDTSRAVLPSQSTLADGSYPLRREVYMILAEGKSGLGTGFVSFVANHKGQRIILKLGIAPHKVPAREVEIVHQ